MSSSDPSEPNRSDNFSDNYNENYKTTPFSYNLIKNIANPFQDTPPKAVTPLDGSRRTHGPTLVFTVLLYYFTM
jgi:hypothetical protein